MSSTEIVSPQTQSNGGYNRYDEGNAYMARARSKVRSGGKRRSNSRPAARKSRSYARPARARRSGSRKSAAGGTRKIVIEFAGAAPVRSGDPVSIGQKVAPRPRVRPKM